MYIPGSLDPSGQPPLNVNRQGRIKAQPLNAVHELVIIDEEILHKHSKKKKRSNYIHDNTKTTYHGTFNQRSPNFRQLQLQAIEGDSRSDVARLDLWHIILFTDTIRSTRAENHDKRYVPHMLTSS